mgnify:CR=1 FL=1
MHAVRIIAVVALVCLLISAIGPVAADEIVHVVKPGETLYRIARQYGTTIQALVAANGIANPNRIYAGQQLVIPGAAAPSQPGVPTANPPPAAPPPGVVSDTGATTVYTVQRGDTLSRIARRFGVSVQSLVAANGIANPNRIYAGQQLRIGGAAVAPAQPAANVSVPASVRSGAGATLTVNEIVYRPESGRVDLMVTVRNNNLLPAIASGNWYPTPNPDGGRQWVTLLKAAHLEVPVPLRGDAPLWEFIVTTNDGLRFSALAGCVYREEIHTVGGEPTAQGGFVWEATFSDGWFECGRDNNGAPKPPEDLRPGQSASVPLYVYLAHPRSDPAQAAARRIARLDFIPYAPSGASFGVQASITFP